MIKEKVLKLKEDSQNLKFGLNFKKGDEFTIVMDVIYMGGFPIPKEMQEYVYGWITTTPNSFEDTTLNWK